MGITGRLVRGLYDTGGLDLIRSAWGDSLTVLAYHRVCEHEGDNFCFFKPNVSASPEMFSKQMQYVSERYSVISLRDLEAFIIGDSELPERPLLITFDDGYLDNYEIAAPILKAFGFPAVIFIVTSRMEDPRPLWWDLCAYYFHHTKLDEVSLPLLGKRSLGSNKNTVCMEIIEELKKLPEEEKHIILQRLPDQLKIDVSHTDIPALFMSWEEVRMLEVQGVLCQPHTVSHPIMSRINSGEVETQLVTAKKMIEQQTGYRASAFAYPNGMPGDYDKNTIQALKASGYTSAFTLSPGPMIKGAVKKHPYQIRRVFLSYRDSLEIFAAKCSGLLRIKERHSLIKD